MLIFEVVVKSLQKRPHYIPGPTPNMIFFWQRDQEFKSICKPDTMPKWNSKR